MESIESKDSATQSETSSQIRQLEAATSYLRRRQEEVQRDLRKPGIAVNRERLRELLTELTRVARALRGQSHVGATL
jgi:hypothetical protein